MMSAGGKIQMRRAIANSLACLLLPACPGIERGALGGRSDERHQETHVIGKWAQMAVRLVEEDLAERAQRLAEWPRCERCGKKQKGKVF
jgi:hypothetical protein